MKTAIACIMASLTLALPMGAAAQWWDPAIAVMPEKLRPPVQYTPALVERAQFLVSEALSAGDFAKLDRMHDEFLELHRKGGPGKDLLYAFFPGLNSVYGNASMREKLDELFPRWRQAAPQSRLRPTAEAAYWVKRAWEARGGGYASTVTPEGWKTFREDLAKALKTLDDGKDKGSESPLWYESALAVAGAMGAPPAALDGVVEEGAAKFPGFTPLYRTRLNYLLPKWGGDYRTIDRFIRAVVMHTQATTGTTYYATLYSMVMRDYQGEDFFRETAASWPLLRHAFEEQVARGEADVNVYATFACIARDRETTARLLEQLGDDARLGGGSNAFSPEACEALVREGR